MLRHDDDDSTPLHLTALPDVKLVPDSDLRDLTVKLQQVRLDLGRERKKKRRKGAGNSRREERLQKKMAELNTRIILQAPSLPLKIFHQSTGKSYLLLMSSDYERIEWEDLIMKQQENCFKSYPPTPVEIAALLNDQVELEAAKNKVGRPAARWRCCVLPRQFIDSSCEPPLGVVDVVTVF